MIKGMTPMDLVNEIRARSARKCDLLVPMPAINMQPTGLIDCGDYRDLKPMEVAHGNIAEITKIPMPYYRRLQAAPELLSRNVNHWWPMEGTRFVRTYNQEDVRCILSDKYQPLEYEDMSEALIPHLYEGRERFRVMSSNLTERAMHIQFIDMQLEAEIRTTKAGREVGEPINGGFYISDSEVGEGRAEVRMFLHVLSCRNGAVREHALSKVHLGKRLGNGHVDIYSHDTRRAAVDLFRKEVRDALNWGFNKDKFREEVEKFQLAADNTFKPSEAPAVIKEITNKYNMTQNDGASILNNLMESGDFSQWGLAQAVTAMVHGIEDVERGIELEKIGGKILG